jgi:hypothetical protein
LYFFVAILQGNCFRCYYHHTLHLENFRNTTSTLVPEMYECMNDMEIYYITNSR